MLNYAIWFQLSLVFNLFWLVFEQDIIAKTAVRPAQKRHVKGSKQLVLAPAVVQKGNAVLFLPLAVVQEVWSGSLKQPIFIILSNILDIDPASRDYFPPFLPANYRSRPLMSFCFGQGNRYYVKKGRHKRSVCGHTWRSASTLAPFWSCQGLPGQRWSHIGRVSRSGSALPYCGPGRVTSTIFTVPVFTSDKCP